MNGHAFEAASVSSGHDRLDVPPVRFIRGLDGLEDLAEGWDRLAAQAARPMEDLAWISACAAAFVADGELCLAVAGEPPRITAIAPLWKRRGSFRRLQLLGSQELGEPTDFVFREPSDLIPLTEALVRSKTPLFLNRCPADSLVVSTLRHSCRGRGVVISRPTVGTPAILLDASWTHPEGRLSPGRRSDLRRARRMAERMGPVRCEVLAPGPADVGPLLEEAFRVEAAGWKGRDGSALLCDVSRGGFYRRYAAAAAEKGILRLSFLRIGERAAAVQLGVEWGRRFWLLKIGYDESFARCSPGTLLVLETIRHAAIHGLRSYEFLGTVEPWTRMWTEFERPCVSVRMYPVGVLGLAALAGEVATVARRGLGRVS